MDMEQPKIEILRVNSPLSKTIEKKLNAFEMLEPTEWQNTVVNRATYYLNQYRQRYGDKRPIQNDYVKLRVVGGTDDFTSLLDRKSDGGSVGGFVDPATGELYIAGDYETLQSAHIIVHEMTHYFAGKASLDYFCNDTMEAATELVTIEILTKIMNEQNFSWVYKDENDKEITLTDEGDIMKFLQKYYQVYQPQIEDLTKDKKFDFEETKKNLFSGRDFTSWRYRK